MLFREASDTDIREIQIVRNSVRENMLSDPARVTDEDCREFINDRGKGWVCIIDGVVMGFSIVDMKENNVWALFVHPDHEEKGIGRKLHTLMLDWYFNHTDATIWLSTSPNTRAYGFYHKSGWTETGLHGRDEIRFEMTLAQWNNQVKNKVDDNT